MDIETLMRMQRELYEKHRDTWDPLQPEYARNSLLWLVEEVGEVVAIFKKRGERETAQNSPAARGVPHGDERCVDVFHRCALAHGRVERGIRRRLWQKARPEYGPRL